MILLYILFLLNSLGIVYCDIRYHQIHTLQLILHCVFCIILQVFRGIDVISFIVPIFPSTILYITSKMPIADLIIFCSSSSLVQHCNYMRFIMIMLLCNFIIYLAQRNSKVPLMPSIVISAYIELILS